jgi:hypothetical protein
MEVIKPEEIQLVKFLGAGGYGGGYRLPEQAHSTGEFAPVQVFYSTESVTMLAARRQP